MWVQAFFITGSMIGNMIYRLFNDLYVLHHVLLSSSFVIVANHLAIKKNEGHQDHLLL